MTEPNKAEFMIPPTLSDEARRQRDSAIESLRERIRKLESSPLFESRSEYEWTPKDDCWPNACRIAEPSRRSVGDPRRAERISIEPHDGKGGSDANGAFMWRVYVGGNYGAFCATEFYVTREHVFRKWEGVPCDCWKCKED
jgi:hypothetical protein